MVFAFSSSGSMVLISFGSTNVTPSSNPAEKPLTDIFKFGSENPCNNNSYVPKVAYLEAVKDTSNLVTFIESPTTHI